MISCRKQSSTRVDTPPSPQHVTRHLTGVPASSRVKSDDRHEEVSRASPQPRLDSKPVQPDGEAQQEATGGGGEAKHHLLNVHEVAELLQVPVSWVYGRMRKRSLERMPAYRLGKYWRFRKDEILRWVESQRQGSHVA